MPPLKGIIAYPVTPFTNDGFGINENALVSVTENLLQSNPVGVAFLGSAGESAYLSDEEWKKAAKIGVQTVNGRAKVLLGIGELTTESAIAKARYAEEIGADMLMVIPVSYWKLSDDEIYNHYQNIAAATDLPIMVYNNPATSGVDMSPTLLLRMVNELETVVAIKESSGDLNRMHVIRTLSNGQVPFYNGANHMALEALSAGASGWCTAAPNLLDDKPSKLYRLIEEQKLDEARALFYSLLPVLQFIVTGGLPATIKSALRHRGLEAGVPRLPVLPLTAEKDLELRGYLDDLHIAKIRINAAS